LIRRKKLEMEGLQTPVSSVDGDRGEYRDVFNRRETMDAQRRWKDRDRDRGGGYGRRERSGW
jgi:hypothetical protein